MIYCELCLESGEHVAAVGASANQGWSGYDLCEQCIAHYDTEPPVGLIGSGDWTRERHDACAVDEELTAIELLNDARADALQVRWEARRDEADSAMESRREPGPDRSGRWDGLSW